MLSDYNPKTYAKVKYKGGMGCWTIISHAIMYSVQAYIKYIIMARRLKHWWS